MLCSLVLDLWVGERNPDFAHFALVEQMVHQLNLCTQKGHVTQILLNGCFGPTPKSRSFNIDANVIPVRVHLGKTYSVFPFSTAQLQNYGIVVAEKGGPLALMLKPGQNIFSCGLHHIGKCFVLLEPLEFIFTSHFGIELRKKLMIWQN